MAWLLRLTAPSRVAFEANPTGLPVETRPGPHR